mmetsp:Transcript_9264/g.34747  ORF Transcript_9264/g.34747 Transcript_9264/m.34747 type:complete len:823 (-) Transcript_9264:63-2531(-)
MSSSVRRCFLSRNPWLSARVGRRPLSQAQQGRDPSAVILRLQREAEARGVSAAGELLRSLVREMDQKSELPRLEMYHAVISCCKGQDLPLARELYSEAKRKGIRMERHVVETLIQHHRDAALYSFVTEFQQDLSDSGDLAEDLPPKDHWRRKRGSLKRSRHAPDQTDQTDHTDHTKGVDWECFAESGNRGGRHVLNESAALDRFSSLAARGEYKQAVKLGERLLRGWWKSDDVTALRNLLKKCSHRHLMRLSDQALKRLRMISDDEQPEFYAEAMALYHKHGNARKVLDVYEMMKIDGVEAMLEDRLRFARLTHQQEEFASLWASRAWTLAALAHLKQREAAEASGICARMKDAGLSISTSLKLRLFLALRFRDERFPEALEEARCTIEGLLDKPSSAALRQLSMQEEVRPAVSKVLLSLAKSRRTEEAIALLDALPDAMKPESKLYGSLMRCCEGADLSYARDLYDGMKRSPESLTIEIFEAMLAIHVKAAAHHYALEIHQDLVECSKEAASAVTPASPAIKPRWFTYAIILQMYRGMGDQQMVHETFSEAVARLDFQEQGRRSTSDGNDAMDGPNLLVFRYINACMSAGEVERGVQAFGHLRSHVRPHRLVYSQFVLLLDEADHCRHHDSLISSLPSVTDLYDDAKTEGKRLHNAALFVVSRNFARHGMWDAALAVFGEALDGMQKTDARDVPNDSLTNNCFLAALNRSNTALAEQICALFEAGKVRYFDETHILLEKAFREGQLAQAPSIVQRLRPLKKKSSKAAALYRAIELSDLDMDETLSSDAALSRMLDTMQQTISRGGLKVSSSAFDKRPLAGS